MKKVSVLDCIQDKVKLSPSECKLINMLASGKETDSKALAKKFYKNEIPHNGQIVISNALRSLAKKTARNVPFKVVRGERVGPRPSKVRLEKVS